MSAFQPPGEAMFAADPLTATNMLHPQQLADHRPPVMETFDFGLGQTWRETYGEYFDINPEKYHSSPLPLPPPAHMDMGTYIKTENSPFTIMPSTPLFPEPTYHDLKTAAPPAAKDLGLQDCMFSGNPTSEALPACSMANSPPSYSQAVSPATATHSTSPAARSSPLTSQPTSSPPTGHSSPAAHRPASTENYTVQDLSQRTVEDFEINNPGDILSLDQPINKYLDRNSKYDKKSVPTEPPTSKPSCAGGNGNLDLSALLGLPSISSFLGENEAGNQEKPHNEHVDRILGLSLKYEGGEPKASPESLSPSSTTSDQKVPSDSAPLSPCRGPTPPSLIELQPLKNPTTLTSPKRFTDIFSPRDAPNSSFCYDKAPLPPAYGEHAISRDTYSSASAYYSMTSPKLAYANEHGEPVNFYHSDIFHLPPGAIHSRPQTSIHYN